ncbi:uncharacterized protein LOC135084655 [Ostrinia nubilalis]|uniref:uncharacterized protein LOC135084655 n=1 Tax=Ostrinia nubilalis TaxID=29057 RepID=UPI0030823D4C
MSMKHATHHQVSQSSATHLVMVLIAALEVAHARPCYEGGDFELCFLSKAAINEDAFPDFREQFRPDRAEARTRQKYDFIFGRREIRDIFEDYHKNCTGCDDDVDVADREDHVTQYLSELMVNTDSEITSLQASDVEETRDESGGKEDGYFAFLTGEEKVFEVEGIWSEPAKTIVEESELLNYNAFY